MSIPARVSNYLDAQSIPYELVTHATSVSSISTALSAHIPLQQIAKAVVLEDHQSHHLMAILPADQKISLSKLGEELNRSFHLVKEQQLNQMFTDCSEGAIPTLGSAYNMECCWDPLLTRTEDIYFEAGDHQTLIHLKLDAFKQLMEADKQLLFSAPLMH